MDNSPILKTKPMPNDKKKAAKKKKRVQKQGVRYQKTATRLAKKASGIKAGTDTKKRKKKAALTQSAKNFEKAGTTQKVTGRKATTQSGGKTVKATRGSLRQTKKEYDKEVKRKEKLAASKMVTPVNYRTTREFGGAGSSRSTTSRKKK